MSDILAPGDMAPSFNAPTLNGNPDFCFDSAAGRWTMLLMMGSAADERTRSALALLAQHRALFDDDDACFFGVTMDPADAAGKRIAKMIPGIRWFLDYDAKVSRLYGAVVDGPEGAVGYRPHWLLLDPMYRVAATAKLDHGPEIMARLRAELAQRPPVAATAPVLVVPRVLPPELCRHLIGLHDRDGGLDSGFMRDEDGVTVAQVDHAHKRRTDYLIEDERLLAALKAGLRRALAPMIQRAFQFQATRVERFVVGRYDGETGGHFAPHRDDTTLGTAHRRFACTINLNAEDYDGGDLVFPEFGDTRYRAPTGGAVVFSCSLLHQALPVTRGRRYALLPFLYDEAAARIRDQNLAHVTPDLQGYRSGLVPEGAG